MRSRYEIVDRAAKLQQTAQLIEADARLPEPLRQEIARHCRAGLPTLAPLCPLLLKLHGRPYSLTEHFIFEPLFATVMPRRILLKAARQTAKSTGLAAQGALLSGSVPYLNTLYIEPLAEMTRRFSRNYVEPFLKDGALARLFVEDTGSVLQRTLANGSTMYFSYGVYDVDVDRSRGVPAGRLVIDEIQDIDYDAVDLYAKTLGGIMSWQLVQEAGTPKGTDGTIARRWPQTSQAEWVIKCREGGCNFENIPNVENHLLDMIRPWDRDIGPGNSGLRCRSCGKPLDSRTGHWRHAYPDRRQTYAGHHAPQVILPFHNENPDRWAVVCEAQKDEKTYYNEVLAEDKDTGSALVTREDLKRASCLPWQARMAEAEARLRDYELRLLAVDWGGGGGRLQDAQGKAARTRSTRRSFTKLAGVGTNGGGRVDVFWGHCSARSLDKIYEARLVADAYKRLRAHRLVHDLGGEGGTREALVLAAGVPTTDFAPYRYHGPTNALYVRHNPSKDYPRHWYSLDKSRALGIVCLAIKYGLVRFFAWEEAPSDVNQDLTSDFLALFEERFTSLPLNDTFRVATKPNQSDDFAQACCIGIAHAWSLTDSWPKFDEASKWEVPDDIAAALTRAPTPDWDEEEA